MHPLLGPPSLLLLVAAMALGGVPLDRAFSRRLGHGMAAATGRAATIERWLVRFALGSVSWIALLFVLACVRLFRADVVVPLLLVLALAGALLLRREATASRPGADDAARRAVATAVTAEPGETRTESTSPTAERIAAWVLGAALVMVLAGLWLHALRPDVATDADVYHLTLPRLFLEHGGFYRVPWSVYSNWPLGAELLFAAAMAAADHVLASQLHFAFGVAALALAGLLAATDPPGPAARHRALAFTAALAAATAVLFNPVVLFEIRVAYVDLAQAFFLALGALLLERVRAGQEPAKRGLLLVGLCCGAMTSLKPNGFFGAVPLVLLYLLDEWRSRHRGTSPWPGVWRGLALLGAPAALLAVPWVAKTWLLTGNPVYPFLYDVFGGPEWNSGLSERFSHWQRAIGMGREPLDYLLLPLRLILYGDFGYARFDGRLSPAWIVLLPLAVAGAWRDGRARRLLAVSGVFFVLWAATAQQMRFLIPILPLLAAAAARGALIALAAVPDRSRVSRTVLASAGALALAAALVQGSVVYLKQTPRLLRDYAAHGSRLHEMVRHPVYPWLDSNLPTGAKLLLLGTNRGFFVPREYVADSFFEASQIGAAFGDLESPGSRVRPAARARRHPRRRRHRGAAGALSGSSRRAGARPSVSAAQLHVAGRALRGRRRRSGRAHSLKDERHLGRAVCDVDVRVRWLAPRLHLPPAMPHRGKKGLLGGRHATEYQSSTPCCGSRPSGQFRNSRAARGGLAAAFGLWIDGSGRRAQHALDRAGVAARAAARAGRR